jgi:hypothetical protein
MTIPELVYPSNHRRLVRGCLIGHTFRDSSLKRRSILLLLIQQFHDGLLEVLPNLVEPACGRSGEARMDHTHATMAIKKDGCGICAEVA